MTLTTEPKILHETLKDVASKMLLAARTAPKGRGEDNIVSALIEGDDIKKLSEKLSAMGKKYEAPGFLRDAENVLAAEIVVLIGTKLKALGLKKCGWCGYKDCAEKNMHPDVPCAFNTGDLGIAVGSAVSVAMDHRVDNRIMYSLGMAVIDLGWFDKDVKIVYGIPLSATSKNPFFDRK